jgi:hypothetical protein
MKTYTRARSGKKMRNFFEIKKKSVSEKKVSAPILDSFGSDPGPYFRFPIPKPGFGG